MRRSRFNGAAPFDFSGGSLTIPSSTASATLGQTLLAGFAPEGWRLDMYVRFDTIPALGSGHELAKSALFDVYTVTNAGGVMQLNATFNFRSGGTTTTLISNGPTGGFLVGTWYWITVTWASSAAVTGATGDTAALYIVPWIPAAVGPPAVPAHWEFVSPVGGGGPFGTCVTGAYAINAAAGVAPGPITLGRDPAAPAFVLDGQMDEVKLFNFPACVYFGLSGSTPAEPVQQIACGAIGVRQCNTQ